MSANSASDRDLPLDVDVDVGLAERDVGEEAGPQDHESGSGSPAATPSVNGSTVTTGVVVVVVEEVVDVEVVLDAGVEAVGGAPVDPVARRRVDAVPVELVSSSPVHAASAAPIVPARNPRRVRRGFGGGSVTTPSTHGCRLGPMCGVW